MINWSFHHNFKNIYTYPEQPRKGWELSELFGQQSHLLSLESLQRMFQILFQFSLKSCQFTNLIKDVKDDIIRATQGAAPKHREVANDSRSWKLVEGELSFCIVAAFLHPCQRVPWPDCGKIHSQDSHKLCSSHFYSISDCLSDVKIKSHIKFRIASTKHWLKL